MRLQKVREQNEEIEGGGRWKKKRLRECMQGFKNEKEENGEENNGRETTMARVGGPA